MIVIINPAYNLHTCEVITIITGICPAETVA